jgi:hypothetical protein
MPVTLKYIPADPAKEIVIDSFDGVDAVDAVAQLLGGEVDIVRTRSLIEKNQVILATPLVSLLRGDEVNARATRITRFPGILAGDVYLACEIHRGVGRTSIISDYNLSI